MKIDKEGIYRLSDTATPENMFELGYICSCDKEREEESWIPELKEDYHYPDRDGMFGNLPSFNTELYRKKYSNLYKSYVNGHVEGARDVGIPEP